MVSKISCPKVDGIYCLDHFWNDNAMPEECRRILSKDLSTYYDMFTQGNDRNSLIWRENAIVISMCPGHHRGTHGDLRLVMIADPRKNKKDYMICLFFPEYHNNQYSNAIKNAGVVYKAFDEITFASKKELERFENSAAKTNVRPLVVVGFYRVIFHESNEKNKILQNYNETEKKSNIASASMKQIQTMYENIMNELHDWYECLSSEKYTFKKAYKEVFEPLFQQCSTVCVMGWEEDIKNILMNTKDKNFADFVLPYLAMWENNNSIYSISHGGFGIE
ncbi:MAG: hypothetical protein J6W79_01735 [Alphaproteobacteria bacterium]|nr:hypothetical protein [Alphaproteobacteria bacterium]